MNSTEDRARNIRAAGERTGRAIVEQTTTPDGVDMMKVMALMDVVLEAQRAGLRHIAGLAAPLEENEEYQRVVRRAAWSLQMLGVRDAFAGEPPQRPDEDYLEAYCGALISLDELQ